LALSIAIKLPRIPAVLAGQSGNVITLTDN